ncbi:hypothetical protein GQ53DRAFT_263723 [Thozetella sp. PMI_491]|nr:hypothetical protein GQ53DRAFT_263723 [Thozetella sp. PMI_491]
MVGNRCGFSYVLAACVVAARRVDSTVGKAANLLHSSYMTELAGKCYRLTKGRLQGNSEVSGLGHAIYTSTRTTMHS